MTSKAMTQTTPTEPEDSPVPDHPARRCDLAALIGDTPLIEIHGHFRGEPFAVWAKQEAANLTGSIKDRMALHMLQTAYDEKAIAPGYTNVEATSGNTGIAFAALGRAVGHPVRIYMPDWMSTERVMVIKSHGAEVIPVSAAEGGFLGSIELADRYAAETPETWRPQQFDSPANPAAHFTTTGPELLAQLRSVGREPTGFVAGVGTGGTVMGVGRYLREQVPGVRVHPLEPANSPTLRTGKKVGSHRIQGISDEFIPNIVQLSELDEIIDVRDGDAILMAQHLATDLGLSVGISSGANFLGAVRVAVEQGPDAVVATVFADGNLKYLTTDLMGDEPVEAGDLSPEVKLESFQTIPRLGGAARPEPA